MKARRAVPRVAILGIVLLGLGMTAVFLLSIGYTGSDRAHAQGSESGYRGGLNPFEAVKPRTYLPLALRRFLRNGPPAVDAGVDRTVMLPALATLAGTVRDDGLPDPPGTVTVTWRLATGPGLVTFTAPYSAHTGAAFSTVGTYLLALSADDGELTGTDHVSVTVFPTVPVLVGAGDIAGCGSQKDTQTANLLDRIAGTVFTLGDNVYPNGTAAEFANCYEPTWGRHVARTRPAAGNHDYHTPDASGYFGYFGTAAGDADRGYYSYDVGDWHIVVLNSNCAAVGGCDRDSPQGQWLAADLVTNPSTCTLAYWHAPLFSSGWRHGGDEAMLDVWQVLYEAGADVVLSGHEHNYERFAPQDPHGAQDPARGIRQFVVGTGGGGLYGFGPAAPNSEVRNSETYGVLKLTLHPTGYDWAFVPAGGGTFTDAGSAACVPGPG
jgi:hypothetical protein